MIQQNSPVLVPFGGPGTTPASEASSPVPETVATTDRTGELPSFVLRCVVSPSRAVSPGGVKPYVVPRESGPALTDADSSKSTHTVTPHRGLCTRFG